MAFVLVTCFESSYDKDMLVSYNHRKNVIRAKSLEDALKRLKVYNGGTLKNIKVNRTITVRR